MEARFSDEKRRFAIRTRISLQQGYRAGYDLCPFVQEVYGEIRLRKAVSVALCIVSVTFALIAGKYIPVDINVVSLWIGFSAGLNLLYHGCYKMNH